jgi:hypothetical protein
MWQDDAGSNGRRVRRDVERVEYGGIRSGVACDLPVGSRRTWRFTANNGNKPALGDTGRLRRRTLRPIRVLRLASLGRTEGRERNNYQHIIYLTLQFCDMICYIIAIQGDTSVHQL